MGTFVLAHSAATFAFPEIRRGALPGIVSVAASKRLSPATCSWLFCTGDVIDAAAAKRLGLVDFIGSWSEIDAEVERLLGCFTAAASSVPAMRLRHAAPTALIEADDHFRVASISVERGIDDALAILLLSNELSQLRVLVLHVNGSSENSYSFMWEIAHRVEQFIGQLAHLGVVCICTLQGHIEGYPLRISACAHYRLMLEQSYIAPSTPGGPSRAEIELILHAADADRFLEEPLITAHLAHSLGFASEVVAGSLQQTALRLASWLAAQPVLGVRSVLQLVRTREPQQQERRVQQHLEQRLGLRRPIAEIVRPVESDIRNSKARILADQLRVQLSNGPRPSPAPAPPPQFNLGGAQPTAGICAMEVYSPSHCLPATLLHLEHQSRLQMGRWTTCDEDEDVVSCALTVVRRLVDTHGLQIGDVGYLQVASESQVDRSKAIKTHLMTLFEPHGNCNVEGLDACDGPCGSSQALFACKNWVESNAWDGRWAILVCADLDVADGVVRSACAVAVLVGPGAPLSMGVQPRIHSTHEWSRFRPFARARSELVHESTAHAANGGVVGAMRFADAAQLDHVVLSSEHPWHLPTPPPHTDADAFMYRFEGLSCCSFELPRLIGPLQSTSPFVMLHSLLCRGAPQEGSRIGVLAGDAQSSMSYVLSVLTQVPIGVDLQQRLSERPLLSEHAYRTISDRFLSASSRRHSWRPSVDSSGLAKTFRVKSATARGLRRYEYFPMEVLRIREVGRPDDQPTAGARIHSPTRSAMETLSAALAQLIKAKPSVDDIHALAVRNVVSEGLGDAQDSTYSGLQRILLPFVGSTDDGGLILNGALAQLMQAGEALSAVQDNVPDVRASLKAVAEELIGNVTADTPLMEAGLDSLGVVEFRSRLSTRLNQLQLPETLVFDYPNLRLLELHLCTLINPAAASIAIKEAAPGCVGVGAAAPEFHCSVRVTGVACKLPGNINSSSDISAGLATPCDLVGEVPWERWRPPAFPAGTDDVVVRRTRFGCFLSQAELFDNGVFHISEAEALAMDPQHRLLLEVGYAALHSARWSRTQDRANDTGVSVGIYSTEFARVLERGDMAQSVYAITGSTLSVASGRLSYALGLQGPCFSIDSACSAALVAVHSAVSALRHHECHAHLAMGVNMMLLAESSLAFAVSGMTSASGKSYTFDKRANGFARGEGCTGLALHQRGGVAHSELLGTAVRQDGRTASLTAPNGQAQRSLLLAALAVSREADGNVGALEAHGTGTALGDPVEVRSVVSSLLLDCGPHRALTVGSIKANMGHAETAAGGAGLLKAACLHRQKYAPPNALLRILNPHVGSAVQQRPCALGTQLAGASCATATCGVNSFGYSGTIAHALLNTSHAQAARLA